LIDAERFQAGMEIEATALGVGLALERYRQKQTLDAAARENLARAANLIRHARSGVEMTKTGWLSATPGYDLLALDYTRQAVADGKQEPAANNKPDKELEAALMVSRMR
jgi:hypothetical protein